jgi:hypothetical protein
VEVEGQGVGLFDASKSWCQLWGQYSQCTISTIYVKPEVLVGANLGNTSEVIDRTRINCPGGSDHEKRSKPGSTISGSSTRQGLDIDSLSAIYSDEPERIASQSRNIECTYYASVDGC